MSSRQELGWPIAVTYCARDGCKCFTYIRLIPLTVCEMLMIISILQRREPRLRESKSLPDVILVSHSGVRLESEPLLLASMLSCWCRCWFWKGAHMSTYRRTKLERTSSLPRSQPEKQVCWLIYYWSHWRIIWLLGQGQMMVAGPGLALQYVSNLTAY